MKKVANISILTASIIVILFELYFIIIFGNLFLFNPKLSKIDQFRAGLINSISQKKLNKFQTYNSFSLFLRVNNFDSARFYFQNMDSLYKLDSVKKSNHNSM